MALAWIAEKAMGLGLTTGQTFPRHEGLVMYRGVKLYYKGGFKISSRPIQPTR